MISRIKRSVKFFFQRLFRGWDDSETWNLDISLSKYLLPRLKRFIELSGQQHPSHLTEKEWRDALEDMVFALEFYSSPDRGLDDDKAVKDRAAMGARLLGEHFNELWW